MLVDPADTLTAITLTGGWRREVGPEGLAGHAWSSGVGGPVSSQVQAADAGSLLVDDTSYLGGRWPSGATG